MATLIGRALAPDPFALANFENFAPSFSSAADGFAIFQRGVSGSIPFAILDDSAGSFPPDDQGIIGTANADSFFGIADTVNSDTSGPVSAEWTFGLGAADLAGDPLSVQLDLGAMGDFESSDLFVVELSVGGETFTLFDLAAREELSSTYRLEDGDTFTLNDPLAIGDVLLNNELTTFTTTIAAADLPAAFDQITVRVTAETNGSDEAVALQDLRLFAGVPEGGVDPDPEEPVPPLTPIYTIQGAGHVSPFDGQTVRTSGIVTAVDSNGFYIQDPAGDGIDATSDALFVFTGGAPSVAVGDELELEGTVSEFLPGGFGTGNLSITQIAFPDIAVLSSGNPLPAATILGSGGRIVPNQTVISRDEFPDEGQIDLRDAADDAANEFDPAEDGIDFFESLEGMRVTVEDAVAISPTNRFGETWTLTNQGAEISPEDARLFRDGIPTGIALAADADGLGDLNPERIQIQFDSTLTPGDPGDITNGALLGDVTGVVSYSFGNFEVLATSAIETTPSGIAQEVSELAGDADHVTVISYNILNVSPNDTDQIARIAQQIVDNLNGPDIIALQEVQDNNGDVTDGASVTDDGVLSADLTLQALSDAIVAADGPRYDFVSAVVDEFGETGGIPGGNIRNAFLYNADRVELVETVTLESDVLADFGVSNPDAFDGTRDPLLGRFLFNDEEVTVINNHLSSRFGSDPIFGALQPFRQAAEAAREAQAAALNELVDRLLDGNSDGKIALVGDLNTFDFTNDLAEILPGTGNHRALTNLITAALAEDDAYTFIFQGNSQVLDHAFVSDRLLDVSEVDIVHTNVDFPESGPLFTSDHEPVLARFALPGGEVITGTNRPDRIEGTNGSDEIAGGNGSDLIFGALGSDTISGGNGRDQLFGGTDDDTLLGGNGSDMLVGGTGRDVLEGGNGRDMLVGGADDDLLIGGRGPDMFFLSEGDDTIADFEPGVDSIRLDGVPGDAAGALLAAAVEIEAGLLISFEGGSVLLAGLTLDDAGAAGFGAPEGFGLSADAVRPNGLFGHPLADLA